MGSQNKEGGAIAPPSKLFSFILAAGARAAIAAGAGSGDRVGGGQYKPLLPTVIYKVHLYRALLIVQGLLDHVGKTVYLVGRIRVFGFIQNQSQRGAASAAGREENPQNRIQVLLGHEILDGFGGAFGNFNHYYLLPNGAQCCMLTQIWPLIGQTARKKLGFYRKSLCFRWCGIG